MPLKKTAKKVVAPKEEVAPVVADPRQEAWDKHVADYIAQNPVKGAKKQAEGHFNVIPASFKPGNHLVKYES